MDSTATAQDTICPPTRERMCPSTRETTQCSDWILIRHNKAGADAVADGEKELQIEIESDIHIEPLSENIIVKN